MHIWVTQDLKYKQLSPRNYFRFPDKSLISLITFEC